MQIHELTKKRPTNEGVLGNIAAGIGDVAGRAVMQTYGGTSGGSYGANAGVSQDQAQQKATSLSDPLVKKLATGMKGTFKADIQNQLKTARSPDNTPVTSASQLQPQDIKQALLGEIAKMIGFDYNKLDAMVGSSAGSGTSKQMAGVIKNDITSAVDTITSAETNLTPANVKLQDSAWLTLARGIQSAKSMGQFQATGPGTQPTQAQNPQAQEFKKKVTQAGLTPAQLGVSGKLSDPKTLQVLQAMGFVK